MAIVAAAGLAGAAPAAAPASAYAAQAASRHVVTRGVVGSRAAAPMDTPGFGSPLQCSPGVFCDLECAPGPSAPFPYPGTQNGGNPPIVIQSTGHVQECPRSYSWGFTVSGPATGTVSWDSPIRGAFRCAAYAFVPDDNSNDHNAQYFLFDGSRYLANDAFFTQDTLTDTFGQIYHGSPFFSVSDHLRVTLNDHNPLNEAGHLLAADAMAFVCT
jgi:hypothetical protein